MPRIARTVAGGYPHHIIQRGNNRGQVFFEKDDRAAIREREFLFANSRVVFYINDIESEARINLVIF